MSGPVWDVLVVGAGPSGAAYAVGAAGTGRSVLLVGPTPRHRPNTLELMSDHAGPALTDLGLHDVAMGGAVRCDRVVSRWTGGAPTAAVGGGWIVDRATLDSSFLTAATSSGVCRHPAPVRDLRRDGAGWSVRCAAGSHRARHVVLATGRASGLVARCGLARPLESRLVAVVSWAPQVAGLSRSLYLDTAPDGWWYALGYDAGMGASMGFCTDHDLVRRPVRTGASWHLRPAFTGSIAGPVPDRMQVIGDAALAVDPLSGHGLALAVHGAAVAVHRPDEYPAWLAEMTALQQARQRRVYADAGRAGEFWRRRTPGLRT